MRVILTLWQSFDRLDKTQKFKHKKTASLGMRRSGFGVKLFVMAVALSRPVFSLRLISLANPECRVP